MKFNEKIVLLKLKRLFKFLGFTVLLFLIKLTPVYSDAAEMDVLLETKAVTCAQAARFVLSSSSLVFDGDAFSYAVSKGWIKNTLPDDPIRMDKLSFLLMKAFDMRGGGMYSIFSGPRYAYRSLISRSYIQGVSDPGMTVNGERFLVILGKVTAGVDGQ